MNNLTFTIDAPAHLRKLAESTYSEKEYYLVELIRMAVKRKATEINLTLNKRFVRIEDNGEGLTEEMIKQLISIYSTFDSYETKEQHIEKISDGVHLGMLALFSPSPQSIIIENSFQLSDKVNRKAVKIMLSGNVVKKLNSGYLKKGTDIQIFRKCDNFENEEKTVLKYLTKIDKTVPYTVVLNGKKIEPEGSLSHCIMTEKYETEDNKKADLGIPVKGEICRFTLTHFGIPWSLEMYYPIKGCVFDVVVESKESLSHLEFSNLFKKVLSFYGWLSDYYEKLPLSHKIRVRELIQLYEINNMDSDVFSDAKLYQTATNGLLSLNELRLLSRKGPVCALNQYNKEQESFYPSEQTLIVSDKDLDFLSNKMKMELNILDASYKPIKGFEKLFNLLWNFSKLVGNFFDKLGKKPMMRSLTEEEHVFKQAMRDLFKGSYENVFLSSQKGCDSYHIEIKKNKKILYIHVNHPVIKKMIPKVCKDSEFKIFAWHLFNDMTERRKKRG